MTRGRIWLLALLLITVGLAGMLVTTSVGMGGGDPGRMMGSMMAGSAPETVAADQAKTLGDSAPVDAHVDRAADRVRFDDGSVRLAVLGSPDSGPDMTFRVAGLTDPTIVVPAGATVTIRFINADRDMSHGLIITEGRPPFPYMAMMLLLPAFPGAAALPLGDATDATMPAETITFTAPSAGCFTYLCQVPGHAQQGMFGELDVV